MKITGVKIEKLLLELTSPFRVAFGTITHSENVMIKVTTDEGVTGYGEAAPLAFVTAETTDSVLAALELFRTGLIGMDPLDIEAVHAMMDGLMGGNSSAKCAFEVLWGTGPLGRPQIPAPGPFVQTGLSAPARQGSPRVRRI